MIQKLKSLEEQARILDPSLSKRKDWEKLVVEFSNEFLEQLDSTNALFNTKTLGAGILDFPVTEEPTRLEELLSVFKDHVVEGGINAASARHMGYIPGGGLYPSALGDYLAAVTNKYVGMFYPAPGAVRMEHLLIQWMCDLMGFPESAAGNLTSGGSISNLIAVVTAREASEVKAKDYHRLVIYLSRQTHHSMQKALKIAGLGEAQLGYLTTDSSFRVRSEDLAVMVDRDKAKGLIPWMVCATAGTTNTGTIDPIDDMANVAQKHSIWLHVDAAYGGFFKMIPNQAEKFQGVEKADSITLDPHKSLFLPFGTGAILIKNKEAMIRAHMGTADYLQDLDVSETEINPSDVSPELTKHFRALRMWLPLKLFGLKPFRSALEEKILLARYFHEEVQKVDGILVGPTPNLSVALFRVASASDTDNALTEKLLKTIQADGRVFLSSTTIDGVYWIRVAVLIFRTHRLQIDLLLEIITENLEKIK